MNSYVGEHFDSEEVHRLHPLFLDRECETEGYSYGNPAFCGHLVGEFPHERVLGDGAVNYIAPDNHVPMSEPAENGLSRHWILEIHLIHASGGFGGFLEELLTL